MSGFGRFVGCVEKSEAVAAACERVCVCVRISVFVCLAENATFSKWKYLVGGRERGRKMGI